MARMDSYSTVAPADGDSVVGIDISDTTQNAGGSTKRFLFSAIWTYISGKLGAVATGAQGAKADTALQPAAIGVTVQAYTAVLAGTTASFTTARDSAITANTAKVTNATHTGDVTGSTALTIAAKAVTNAKMADIATARIKGRVTAATGVTEDLTGTQVTTLIDTFTTALKGAVPPSGGGTTNFMRADGTWAAPPGGGGIAWGDPITANLVPDTASIRALGSAVKPMSVVYADSLNLGGTSMTAAALADPNADRMLFWDDSASAVAYLTPGSGLAISGTSMAVDATIPRTDPTGVTGADAITNILTLTTAEYAAIGSKNASTLYIITDA